MKTKLTELLGIRYPIIQGAMAWISSRSWSPPSPMRRTGVINTGGQTSDYIREQIRLTKQ